MEGERLTARAASLLSARIALILELPDLDDRSDPISRGVGMAVDLPELQGHSGQPSADLGRQGLANLPCPALVGAPSYSSHP